MGACAVLPCIEPEAAELAVVGARGAWAELVLAAAGEGALAATVGAWLGAGPGAPVAPPPTTTVIIMPPSQ